MNILKVILLQGEMAIMIVKNTVNLLISALFIFGSVQPLLASEKSDKIEADKNIKDIMIIRMHYIGSISPSEVTVDRGTTVIWHNDSRATLEIQFEGKPVSMACKSPVNFVIDESGSFISNRIRQGSVASLCFVEKGEFNYVARKVFPSLTTSTELRQNIKEFKGKITVK